MKKIVFYILMMLFISACASVQQTPEMTNEAEIQKVMLYDSTSIYLIHWKGHTFIYDKNTYPPIREIE